IADKLPWILKFLPKYERVHLLSANKDIYGGNKLLEGDETGLEFGINFLRLNQKVLGDDFPASLAKHLEKLEIAKELVFAYKDYAGQHDIYDIDKKRQSDYDQEINDPAIIARYLELTPDEPNRDDWQGKLTRRRIKVYLKWLSEHDKERWRGIAIGNPMRTLIDEISFAYGSVNLVDIIFSGKEFDPKDIENKFFKLADLEPKEAKEKWQNIVNIARIQEYIACLESKEAWSSQKIDALNRMRWTIGSNINGLDISSDKIRGLLGRLFDMESGYSSRVTYGRIDRTVRALVNELYTVNDILPGKSIFEMDLSLIKEEIDYFAKYYKEKYKGYDLDYYNRWPEVLMLALLLEMFADERNYFQELIDVLRSCDSVYLNQIANVWERIFEDFLTALKNDPLRGSILEEIKGNVASAEKYYAVNKWALSKLTSEEQFKEIEEELKAGSSDKLISLIQGLSEKGPHGLYNIMETVYLNKYSQMIADYREVENLYVTMRQEYPEVKTHGSLEYAFKAHLDAVVKKAQEFISKYDLAFNQEDKEKIETGNLYPLSKYLEALFERELRRLVDFMSDDSIYRLRSEIFDIQALVLFASMIDQQGFSKVEFNSQGVVDMKGMFSMFKEKEDQETNDVHFDVSEYIRTIAAANMAGKTFFLKALTMAMQSGMNTGFIPADSATMPFFDHVVYFDRVARKLDRTSSSLSSETEYWKSLFNIIKSNMKVFVIACVDEAFSTTSPKYQASLVYAVVMQIIKEGQYLAIASHNHDVLQVLRELEEDLLKSYTLDTKIDKDGKPKFSYKLVKPGEEEIIVSHAIPVARSLGMPEEVLKIAEEVKERIRAEGETPSETEAADQDRSAEAIMEHSL
ncbi:hypothetical protein ACFLQ8_03965, partial [Candidatus Auribacterota bacterium]